MKDLATYIIYYVDQYGQSEGYSVIGYKSLLNAMKYLHSDEVKATDISIYKEGPDFENNKDDVIECHKRLWK